MNQQINSDRQRGLYRPEFEHDNCGVGMVANLSGEASHDIVVSGVTILKRLLHRGATGNDPETGDGAGLLLKIPHEFFEGRVALLRDRTRWSASLPRRPPHSRSPSSRRSARRRGRWRG